MVAICGVQEGGTGAVASLDDVILRRSSSKGEARADPTQSTAE